jgi:hypothetical protein
MADSTGTRTSTAQATKAAQCSVLSLLKEIKATGRTNEALEGLCQRLFSAENVLGNFASASDRTGFCKLNPEVQHHIRLAIWGGQDACARFQNAFKEWTSHFSDHFLHESGGDDLDILEGIELRLLSERLQLLEKTIGMALEVSALYVTVQEPWGSHSWTEWLTEIYPELLLFLRREISLMRSVRRCWPKRMICYQRSLKRTKGNICILTDDGHSNASLVKSKDMAQECNTLEKS